MDRLKLVHTPMATSQIYTRAANGNSGSGNGNAKKRKGQTQSGDVGEAGETEGKKRKGGKGGGKTKGKGGGTKGRGMGSTDNAQSERQAAWQNIIDAPIDLQSKIMSQEEASQSQPMEEEVGVGGEVGTTTTGSPIDESAEDMNDPAAAVFAGPRPDADRQILWLDDMVSSCLKVVDFEFGRDQNGTLLIPKNLSEAMVVRVMSFYFSASLEFAWKKTLTLSGRTLKCWTQVRHALQDLIRNAFIEMKKGSCGSGDMSSGSASASAVVLGHNSNNAIVSRLLFLGFNFRAWSTTGAGFISKRYRKYISEIC